MTIKGSLWALMTLLALLVAAYAIGISSVAEIRPPLVRTLFQQHRAAVLAHFLGGAVGLLTGAAQLSSRLRTGAVRLHRGLGRIYVLAILVGGVAGFILALNSSAGSVARAGFGALAVCWLASTVSAYFHIRRGNLPAHRSWMIRSYALTLAAVTLRLYLPVSQIAGISMTAAYPAIAWLCWVPNLLIAEWFVRSRHARAMLPRALPSGAHTSRQRSASG
jgi:uncharacterized membrane protein